jgi:propionyl-CoA synthetase
MVPQAVYSMLACSRLGVIHSVVFGGFSAKELSNRIDDCKPKLIITSSCGLEPGKVIHYRPIVDDALKYCQKIETAYQNIKRLIF